MVCSVTCVGCLFAGFGLLHFVYQFSISPHVMFSLLIGRPVIILGSAFLEKEIRAIVNALWLFIPGHLRLDFDFRTLFSS
jgi:hypothetical protein